MLEIGWNWPGASAARLLLSVIVNVCLAVVVVLQLHGHDGQGQGWPNVVEVCGKGSCRGCAAPRTCAAPSGLLYGMQCSVEAPDCCVCTVDLCVQALGGRVAPTHLLFVRQLYVAGFVLLADLWFMVLALLLPLLAVQQLCAGVCMHSPVALICMHVHGSLHNRTALLACIMKAVAGCCTA